MIKEKNKVKILGTTKFLSIMVLIYILGFFINPDFFAIAAINTIRMFADILPIMSVVFIVLWVINYLVGRGRLKQVLSATKGVKGWIMVIVSGILISGPPYILYPLLKELKANGMSNAHLAVFLYNRNVKIPFIPVSIYYFGLWYTVILSALLIFFSIINGYLVGRLVNWKSP